MTTSDSGGAAAQAAGAPDAARPATEIMGSVIDALGALASALGSAFAALIGALPEWVFIAAGFAGAALVGTLVGAKLTRRGQPPPAAAQTAEAAAPEAEQKEVQQPENPAFKSYQRILEEKGIPAKEQDIQMREFARQFADMGEKLANLAPGHANLKMVVDEAARALEAGAFGQAIELLGHVGDQEADAGGELRKTAARHLGAAATAKSVAGDLHMAQMAYQDAAICYRQALDALPEGSDALRSECLNKHGTATYQAGDLDSAAMSFGQALTMLEKSLGDDHADVATALNNLALLHYSRGDFKSAEPLYQRALAIDEKVLGEDNPGVATDLNNLALLYKKQGKFKDAEPLLRRALAIKEKAFDPGHPSLVTGLKNYAALLRALDRGDEAAKYESRAARLPPKRRAGKAAE
ncbi:MAG: tetratricopeptide repeat protein [Rhodospirillales bacterium]|nr:tetratricopeptide repeat protein [Rhodospirillales bacterium]